MAIPLNLQPLEKLPKYPHLEPLDAAIWNAWLDTALWPNAVVAYDVHVGTPASIPPDSPNNFRNMVEHLSTLRIDVVIFLQDKTLVTEIKPSASLSAIGQALGYTKLFLARFPHARKPTPTILTDIAKPDTPGLCKAFNILLLSLGRLITT